MTLCWHLPWVIAFVISLFAVKFTIRLAARWGLFDKANDRSLHQGSKPRSGGLGILIAIICGWIMSAVAGYPLLHWQLILFAALVVAAVSLWDDFRDVAPLVRVTVHLLAAATPISVGFGLQALTIPGGSLALGVVASGIMSILFVVWFINLYNFMDGMDGFAGGMTLFGFTFLAVLGLLDGDAGFALAALVVAASAGGFVFFNFPPARVFMGDVGAAPLGFLVGVFGLWADAYGVAPVWVTVMIFSPFFLDATVTAGLRLIRRERFWEAHRSHYYQRLVQTGWSHRRVVLCEYTLMLGCGTSALLILNVSVLLQWMVILVWLGLYSICAVSIHARERGISHAD